MATMAVEGQEPLRDWIYLSILFCFSFLFSGQKPFPIFLEILNSDGTEILTSENETAAAHDGAISELSRMKDILRDVLTHYEGCVKSYVTKLKHGFNEFSLKNVIEDIDEHQTLGETLLHHIQWPRKEINFMDEIPKAPPRATNVDLQLVMLSLTQQLSHASPKKPNTHNPMADASTYDQPA
ncbi:hypothetical protein D1007_25184 [Hordeum vulgare]|nr:hypothetical protein D1007_25184 [Hordeum vulgare]